MLPFGLNNHQHMFPCVCREAAQTSDPLLSCKKGKKKVIRVITKKKQNSFNLSYYIMNSLYLSATLYFIPSFSISAITQSVIYGIPGLDWWRKDTNVHYMQQLYRLKKVSPSLILTFCIQAIHH